MCDVITAGELLIDFTPASYPGAPVLFSPNPGGAPANVAVQLAKLGIQVGFIGKVGNDSFGTLLTECLRSNGVNTEGVVKDNDYNTTLSFVELNSNGDRSFTFYRKHGADTRLRTDEVDLRMIYGCRLFHFGSVSLTDQPSRETTSELVKTAFKCGKLISYDPNRRPALWASESESLDIMRQGLPYCHILKVSEDELLFLSGASSISEGIAYMVKQGIKIILVTLGADGCVFSANGFTGSLPAFAVNAVDTTASGDCFFGAFISCLIANGFHTPESLSSLTHRQLMEFCKFASAAGAVCASEYGGIPSVPDLKSIRECIDKTPLRTYGKDIKRTF